MNREELTLKWLNNDLNDQELQAFKNLEDYDDLVKLNSSVQAFKAEGFYTSAELESVLSKITPIAIKSKKQSSTHWFRPFMRVAAILAVCFGLYYYTTTLNTTITTEFAQKTTVELPDASSVSLNAKSLLAFNKKDWKHEREVELQGEAFFKVAKGSSFHVITKSGTVTVYGTQFNVKQRDNYFEVICYEGLVGVTRNSQETKLKPGDSFLIIDGKVIAKEKENRTTPSWLNNESLFKSIPFKEVIAEFERQYNVTFDTASVNTNQLVTVGFPHDSLDVAIKNITVPLHLTYSKTNNTITLKRE